MESGTPIGGNRRGFRRWRLVAIGLLVSPFVLLLLVNLILGSPWSRRWLAGKIGQRAGGLEARVDGATWSPWNGFAVRGIELLQPTPLRAAVKEPLLRVDAVKADPVWRAWLRGNPEITGLVVESPRLVLPMELVSHLAGSAPAPAPAAAAPAAAEPQAQTPPATTAVPGTPPSPTIAAPPVAAPPPQPAPAPAPTAFVTVRNASASLILASHGKALLDLSGITGRIPMAGGPANSRLEIGPLKAAGQPLVSSSPMEISWSAPFLSLQPLQMDIGGHPLVLAGRVAMFSGLPIQIEARAPRHELKEITLPLGVRASAQSIAAEARFRGLLLSPASWQGDFLGESIAPVVKAGGQTTRFDRASTVTVLRGGILSCVDARIVGDDASLLGNATVLADGRCAGALRLVAAPASVIHGAKQFLPMLPGEPSLTPLSTPQRAAFDLEAFGNIGHLFLRLGKGGPVVEFKP